MAKHRVDISMKGMSHFVDGQFDDATGYPVWENKLPKGLYLEKNVGRSTGKDRKFVRTPGFGTSVEWTSNKDDRGAQGGQYRGGPPPEQQRGPHPGPQRREWPGQGPERGQRQDPGIFDVPGGDGNDDDDAHSMAPSRRDDYGIVNDEYYRGSRQGHNGPYRTMREESPGRLRREQMHREAARPYGYASHQGEGDDDDDDNYDYDDEFDDACSRAPLIRDDDGLVNCQDYGGYPRGHDGPDPTMRDQRPGRLHIEQVDWEAARPHGPVSYGDNAQFRAPSKRENSGNKDAPRWLGMRVETARSRRR